MSDVQKIKRKILLPIMAAIFVLIVVAVFGVFLIQKKNNHNNALKHISQAKELFMTYLSNETLVLASHSAYCGSDPEIRRAFAAHDRDALYRYCLPLFQEMKSRFKISHFYFIDPSDTCFLRVHNPPRFGDRIARVSYQQAKRSQKAFSGIELGAYGMFTLRYVCPIKSGKTILGYIELGMEIEHITLGMKRTLGIDLVATVDKVNLAQKSWQEGLKVAGKHGQWNEHKDFVVIDKTIDAKNEIEEMVLRKDTAQLYSYSIDGRYYISGMTDLRDIQNKKLGYALFFIDSTEQRQAADVMKYFLLFFASVVAVVLLYFFNQYLSKIEDTQVSSHDTIKKSELELKERNEELTATEEELRQNNEELVSLNEELDKQKQYLKEIIENQGEGFGIVDHLGVFRLINPAAAAVFRLTVKDMLHHPFSEFVDEDNFRLIQEQLKKRKAGQKSTYELTIRFEDGGDKVVSVTGVPFYDKHHGISGSIVVIRDVTQLKIVEADIKKKNNELKKYFTAIEQNFASIVITDTEGTIEYVNPKFEETTGYSAAEAIGQNPRILKSGKSSAEKYASLWETIKKGEVWRGEFSNCKKNKEIYVEKATISPIRNSSGEITHFIAIKEDITELKQAEKIIKEKNKQQAILINNLPAHISFKDAELRYQLVNKSFADSIGLPINRIVGKLEREVQVSMEKINTSEEIEKQVLETQQPCLNYESWYTDSEGEKHWTSISKVPYYNENSELVGIVGVVQDITQRKNYEQTIVEKTRQFENTINSLEDIYFKTDLKGNLVQASPSMCDFFGYSSIEELMESNAFEQIYITVENRQMVIDNLLIDGKMSHYFFAIQDVNGEPRYGEANAVVWQDKDDKPMGFEGIIRDVSERVKFEKMLNEMNTDLSESLKTAKKQKVIIEKAHKDITDSIKYAQTIQNGFLPQDELIRSYFEEYFLFFKPRDIVSGDFYYVNKHRNQLIFAVADCTGHGVPGGFMTILGIIYLHEIVLQGKLDDAGLVLERLRERLKSMFRSLGNDSKNGLDIVLCIVDTETSQMKYAGAFNPLYIIRNGSLMEFKASKCPIGHYQVERKFENNTIELENNDLIYLCSDGLQDQFGGESNRKFTKNRFRELLLSIHSKTMSEQQEIIAASLANWQGKLSQTDDITLFGVKWQEGSSASMEPLAETSNFI